MKSQVLALVAISLIANTGWAANKGHNKEENIGVGTGAAIGAIAGGPVGMAIGLAIGGWLGNVFHDERKEKEEYAARYEESARLADSLEELLAGNENQIEQLQLVMNKQHDDYQNALRRALDIEVYFHTGESVLDSRVAERVEELGKLMQDFDDFVIVVEGHADPRGEESFNDQLSAERAAAVRDALIRSGLPSDRISTRAEGERGSAAAEGDLDAMALERRVDLSIVNPLPRENRVAQQ